MISSEITIKCFSLNIAGLMNLIKRKRIEKFLWSEHLGIVCCQETHLLQKEKRWLRKLFPEEIHHAPGTTRAGGIMIGIAKNCPWH